MGDRALAHIERVVTTYPIEGADKIEMTQVLDFHVVTKKGEFKAGDLALYVEVDAILPDGLPAGDQARYDELKKLLKKATGEDIAKYEAEMAEVVSRNTRPEFEFLRAKKFRIKAQRYGAFKDVTGNTIISQGIIFPISIIPTNITPIEGQDLTAELGITRVIEDPDELATNEPTSSTKKSGFEKFMDHHFMRYSLYRKVKSEIKGYEKKGVWEDWLPPKSDEENIQKIYTSLWNEFGDTDGWYASEKLEGENFSAYTHITSKFFGLSSRIDFGVCSRTRNLITDDGSRFWQTAKELDLEKRLKAVGKNIVIRGEHLGPKVQGNLYKLTAYDLVLFEVWDIEQRKFYNYYEFMEFCEKYGFKHVPIIDDNFRLLPSVGEMLKHSNGISKWNDKIQVLREGVVYRRKDNPRKSFKIRDPEYLLLHGK